jgi:hypothetical protein
MMSGLQRSGRLLQKGSTARPSPVHDCDATSGAQERTKSGGGVGREDSRGLPLEEGISTCGSYCQRVFSHRVMNHVTPASSRFRSRSMYISKYLCIPSSSALYIWLCSTFAILKKCDCTNCECRQLHRAMVIFRVNWNTHTPLLQPLASYSFTTALSACIFILSKAAHQHIGPW